MRVLNRLIVSGSFDLGSSAQDQFTIGNPDTLNDKLTVWANSTFKNNIVLSGSLNSIGYSTLTGSFSGSGKYLTDITSSNIDNFSNDVRKQMSGLGGISYNPVTGEISYSGAGGDIYTEGNITGSGTVLNPIRTKDSISASSGISASYFYGDGSGLTNLPGGMSSVYTGGNITGSGLISDPLGINVNPIFNNVTGSSVSASYFYGDGSGLTNLPSGMSSVYVGGNITGSGLISDPLGVSINPIFNNVTASSYTGSFAKLDYIDFNSSNPSFNIGRLHYDTAAEILKFDLPYENTELNIGKQLIAKVKNVTGQTINKGKVVYVGGAQGASEILYVVTASWDSDPTSAYTFGFTMSELANQDIGYVILEGILEGISTTGYSAGSLLYLSSSGDFTTTKPIQPKHAVRLGYIAREQDNNGSIFVRIQNGYELDELHDVLLTSPTNYDLLVRDVDGLWKNTKILAGNYVFSGNSEFTGSLYGTASYALDADKLDGQDSSLFALKTDVTGAVSSSLVPYSLSSDVSSSFVTPSQVSGAIFNFPTRLEVTGALSDSLNPYAKSVDISSSFGLKEHLTASYAQLSQNNIFTGVNTLGAFTGSSAFISGDVRINGTASVALLETINQTSLNVGDKYIIILSGSTDHPSLDSSGLLWGSGAVNDPTQGPLGEMAYIRYYAASDQLEIFPGLKVSGSLTSSAASLFTQITASSGYVGRLYDTASYALDADKLDGQDSSLFALKTDVTGALIPYGRSEDISSSFGLKSDLTSSYARLGANNTFTQPNNFTEITASSGINAPLLTTTNNIMVIADNNNLEKIYIAPSGSYPGIIIGNPDAVSQVAINGDINTRNTTVNNLNVNGIADFNLGIKVPFIKRQTSLALDFQQHYIVAFSGSNLTGTLPNASDCPNTMFIIKNLHISASFVTSSVSKIDDLTTGIYIRNRYTSYNFVSDGTDWWIV